MKVYNYNFLQLVIKPMQVVSHTNLTCGNYNKIQQHNHFQGKESHSWE